MPWNKNKNGEKVYNLSLYTKEELPTWGELHELYSRGKYFYDPEDPNDQSLDIYWKIPRQKYLLAIICNQFNKMIFEDKFDIMKSIRIKDCKFLDFRFLLGQPSEEYINSYYRKWFNDNLIATTSPPPIITIPMPNGEKNPFIVNDHPRVNINDLGYIELIPVMTVINDDKMHIVILNNSSEEGISSYKFIMNRMFKSYIEYFEEPVGWKDKDSKPSHTIGVDISSYCK